MLDSLNFAQAKLLADFCSDLAKGLLLAGIAAPFISREAVFLRLFLGALNCIVALNLLKVAVKLLERIKQ